MAFKFLQSLGADDIFISYTRLDASTYAAGLADELTKLGFSCFIDRLGTDPNRDLPDTLRRKIRSCSMLVVVGTERAGQRETIEEEIREFLSTGRTSIVPVNFDDAVYGARWYTLVEGIAPEPELNPAALDDGEPSPSVVSRIRKQFNYRRRDERLRRTTRRAVAVLVLLVVAIAAAAFVAWQQLRVAAAATATATQETERAARATRDAQAAQDAAHKAAEEANAARDEATRQRDEATRQKGIADDATRDATEKARLANEAARRAKEAEGRATNAQARADSEQARAERQSAVADIRAGANRSQSYLRLRPEDVQVSLSFALDAMKLAARAGIRNADADTALRESLALLPLRRGHVRLDTPAKVAFSPDGLHYATVASKALRVYATPDGDDAAATPLLERPCECEAVALASGLTYAAAMLDGGVFRIFDLKDDSRSRALEPVKGARGEKITSAKRLALSPDGQYLALYADEGDEDSDARHSKLVVIDVSSGEPVKIYDDDAPGVARTDDLADGPTGKLNMVIWDVAFGPTGDLAIAGKRPGTSEHRVVLWRLDAKAPAAGARPRLTADSFDRYEVIPQEEQSSVVAPGADETCFATDKGVWKRPARRTSFDPVARMPSPFRLSFSFIDKMAFHPDGKSLVAARITIERSAEGKVSGAHTDIEVWDAAGHRDAAEAFHTRDVAHVGFEPGGRLVASLTGYASRNLRDGPMGENRAHRLRVYHSDTGTEVPSDEPKDADRSVFYVGPDAAQIVTLSGDAVQVWNVWEKDEARRKRAASFRGALEGLGSVALSHGGRFLALAGRAGDETRVVVYRSEGGAYSEVKRFGLGPLELRFYGGLALSADGRRLAVLGRGDEDAVRVYDDGVENTALRKSLGDAKNVQEIALSADGRYLVVTDSIDIVSIFRQTGRTRLLDTREGFWETLLDDEYVTAIAFSPDGAYVGLGSEEGVLHVFETARPKDDNASKGDARNLKEEVARIRQAGGLTAIAFSDDGRYVATASGQRPPYEPGDRESYPLRVWLLRPADLIAESERRLGQVKPPER